MNKRKINVNISIMGIITTMGLGLSLIAFLIIFPLSIIEGRFQKNFPLSSYGLIFWYIVGRSSFYYLFKK